MKLVTFRRRHREPNVVAGWLIGDWVISAMDAHRWVRSDRDRFRNLPIGISMNNLLQVDPSDLLDLNHALGNERLSSFAYPISEVRLLPPLPRPRTIRDFYAFEQHVRAARARRGLEVPPEWYRLPVFYFTNPNALFGPEDLIPKPKATTMLDFELEVAAVLRTDGRDIPAELAETHIAGYMIMNDWSARDIQGEEMRVGLGPAKGKDFATSFGPWLVTPDELADRSSGKGYDLKMLARINGREVASGNLKDLTFSFGEMIARASEDCSLYQGEVIGSGTVGTGCLLETEAAPWLQSGDVVELEVERLGLLRNTVR